MTKPVARIGDFDIVHCSQPVRAEGATTVFVNGRPWSRLGDMNAPHLKPSGAICVPHAAPIAKGSTIWFIEGKPAGRIGDPIADCTAVATGSQDVFCGG